jgi:hypothetical protein
VKILHNHITHKYLNKHITYSSLLQ